MMSLRENPFRLFFSLGILFALVGVGEWVFWSLGRTIPEVGLIHSSLQVQGFLTCFVVGFLMTAFPRFTGTDIATSGEIFIGMMLCLGVFGSLITRNFLPAQFFFGAIIILIVFFGARRLGKRRKPLPPPFLLMGFGFLHAFTGIVLTLISHLGTIKPTFFFIGRQMLQLGFLLCMVLGITGQLAPFLMGYGAEPGCDDDQVANLRSGPNAMWLHAVTGLVLYGSFWLSPWAVHTAYLLRALTVSAHFLFYARISRPLRKKTAVTFFFKISMWMIVLGLWGAALLPVYRIAMLHMVFIGGFSLMIFSFGQQIVLSHSAQISLLSGRLIPLRIIGSAVMLAMVMRVMADFLGNSYMWLIHASSGLWVLAAGFWLVQLLILTRS